MIACILGRQPELSLAELEQRFGAEAVFPFSREVALVESAEFSIEQLGGVIISFIFINQEMMSAI